MTRPTWLSLIKWLLWVLILGLLLSHREYGVLSLAIVLLVLDGWPHMATLLPRPPQTESPPQTKPPPPTTVEAMPHMERETEESLSKASPSPPPRQQLSEIIEVVNIFGHLETYDESQEAQEPSSFTTPSQFSLLTEQLETIFFSDVDFEDSLRNRELLPYFQPIIKTQSGEIIGLEALLCWQHPKFGLLFPQEYAASLEQSEHIAEIYEYMLTSSLSALQRWQANTPELMMYLTLPPQLLTQLNFLETISALLDATPPKPHTLCLALEEEVMLGAEEELVDLYLQLTELDLLLSIDDFAHAHTSLGHLHHYPLHSIRIDLAHLNESSAMEPTISTIRTIAAQLELEIFAKGIENLYYWEFIQQHRFPYAQGSFIHPLLPPEEVPDLLRQRMLQVDPSQLFH